MGLVQLLFPDDFTGPSTPGVKPPIRAMELLWVIQPETDRKTGNPSK